jgi:Fe-S-cluster containining protein
MGNEVFVLKGNCQPEKCDAYCCRNMVFEIPKINENDAQYFRLHGCQVEDNGSTLRILVHKICDNLGKFDLNCYDYENRPAFCRKYAKLIDDSFSSPDCTLVWMRVGRRKADFILQKTRKGLKISNAEVVV